jgi:hypothetical protein
MKFPEWLPVFGATEYRGECPKETAEQITFVSRVRREYPETHGRLIVHIQNEGKRTAGQTFYAKASGLTKGASDIVIPGERTFICEIKRADHTKSKWQDGQLDYLKAAHDAGAFACVALGADGASAALAEWIAKNEASYA